MDWTTVGAVVPDTSNTTNWPVINTDVTDIGSCTHFTTADKSGASDMTSRIQCYLTYANNQSGVGGRQGTVVLLGSGTFTTSASLYVYSNTVLRGSGPANTIVRSSLLADPAGVVQLGAGVSGCPSLGTISARANIGDTVLQFASDPGIAAGTYFVFGTNGSAWQTQHLGRIASGSGTTRTLDAPVRMVVPSGTTLCGTNSTPNPGAGNIEGNAGVESVHLDVLTGLGQGASHPVFFWVCNNCWVVGSELSEGGNKNVFMPNSRNITVQGNNIHNIQRTDCLLPPNPTCGHCDTNISGDYDANHCDNSEGIDASGSQGMLIANNSMSNMEASIKFQGNAAVGVYAYNYTDHMVNNARDAWGHGQGSAWLLAEGNVGNHALQAEDCYWTPCNTHFVFYRNRYLGVNNVYPNAPYSGQPDGRAGVFHDSFGNQGPDSYFAVLLGMYNNVFSASGTNCPYLVSGNGNCNQFDWYQAGATGSLLSQNLWAEKNRFVGTFWKDNWQANDPSNTYVGDSTYANASGFMGPLEWVGTDPANGGHSVTTGYPGTSPPSAWSGSTFPASLFLTSKPSWWCNEAPWPATGADIDNLGNLAMIPAQRTKAGLSCTTAGNGVQIGLGAPGQPILVP
jgi:hypothetical protein